MVNEKNIYFPVYYKNEILTVKPIKPLSPGSPYIKKMS